ncbi:carbon storage regulator [Calycomorphotria hydatis]|uniref:Carbon storage regulator n=1 Tax=Calycomorphotria hydatis TaxID=2528027 RepID=A0A517TAW9_9PLAN|nr:carbon storage regulator [Calycomorphotria hydatis]QDT65510.1 carbon storage regulator [Calycomorphotria hydatis]
MLVISRKAQQEVMIGDNIVLKVVKTRSGRVKLAIQAPNEIPIQRLDGEPVHQHSIEVAVA